MNLIIDIGNTCVKLGCFDDDTVVEEQRIGKDEIHLLEKFCDKYDFKRGIIGTVADIPQEFEEKLMSLPFPMLKMESGVTPVPIINKYHTPKSLGSDRLAAAIAAAWLQPERNVLIVDIGTCITYDFVNAKGEYLGGNISPGPDMRFRALNQFTSRLPLVEREGLTPQMGTTTETAIRSGVILGVEYEIEGYIRRFLEKYPDLYVYLTGGVHLGMRFKEKFPIFADDYIVPKGLNRILKYNEKNM